MNVFRRAAPSCVHPLPVGPACARLAGVVPEVALMFLETEACLAYGEEDLPSELATLPLRYHVHLPLDVPWERGVEAAGAAIDALVHKAAFVGPHALVLHPPTPYQLEGLLERSPKLAASLALENVPGADLTAVWPLIEAYNLGVCLDVGHLVTYGQQRILDLPDFFSRIRLLHVYGGEPSGRHLPLGAFPDPELLRQILCATAAFAAAAPVSLVLEVFSWPHWEASAATLSQWAQEWGLSWSS
ncbi:MAG: sugar phosphate isomerase/epimerase [Desulfomicrobiaceae bacterium]|nr:sugar phosphate isomerase/epimerase [Desulfomicrobiaceae bacterium]